MAAGAEHRWTQVLINAGEPTNSLRMWGIERPGGSVDAVGCRLSGHFKDGPVNCGILPDESMQNRGGLVPAWVGRRLAKRWRPPPELV